jgi:hypothetical protein
MSLCRRYLNLLVNEHIPGVKSLRFIDLKLQRQRLFYPGTPPRRDGTPAPASEMETLRLPRPSFTFRPGDSTTTTSGGSTALLVFKPVLLPLCLVE